MSVKYIGLDVHQATISIAVLDAHGKLLMQSVIATQASAILDFVHGVRGELHLALEEGSSAHWLWLLRFGRIFGVRSRSVLWRFASWFG